MNVRKIAGPTALRSVVISVRTHAAGTYMYKRATCTQGLVGVNVMRRREKVVLVYKELTVTLKVS